MTYDIIIFILETITLFGIIYIVIAPILASIRKKRCQKKFAPYKKQLEDVYYKINELRKINSDFLD